MTASAGGLVRFSCRWWPIKMVWLGGGIRGLGHRFRYRWGAGFLVRCWRGMGWRCGDGCGGCAGLCGVILRRSGGSGSADGAPAGQFRGGFLRCCAMVLWGRLGRDGNRVGCPMGLVPFRHVRSVRVLGAAPWRPVGGVGVWGGRGRGCRFFCVYVGWCGAQLHLVGLLGVLSPPPQNASDLWITVWGWGFRDLG